MDEWLKWQHLSDMQFTVHDLEVMASNTGQVEFGMHSTSVKIVLKQKNLTPR